jgi:hypothetical protein
MSDWDDDDIIFDSDPLTDPIRLYRPVVERFLLGIIDAHRVSENQSEEDWRKEREGRLSQAKEVLFGEQISLGPKEFDDRLALAYMASGYRRDLFLNQALKHKKDNCGPFKDVPVPDDFKKARSVLQLAKDAIQLTSGNSDDAIVERLRKAFAEEKIKLIEVDEHSDAVAETVEYQILLEIKKLLKRIGIPMKALKYA